MQVLLPILYGAALGVGLAAQAVPQLACQFPGLVVAALGQPLRRVRRQCRPAARAD